jgi:diadenosine tetraphosphate (Ap4A) HIT family hydrolase
MNFELNARLQQDTLEVMDLHFSRLLLMNDSRFPWLVLVPMKNNILEIFELEKVEQHQLLLEITEISKIFKTMFNADKLNVASIGNIVPQLHVHIIARTKNDSAWPSPVWGFGKSLPYSLKQAELIIHNLKDLINSKTALLYN